MATKYQYGVRIERQIIDFLRRQKYSVMRSAGSKGVVDIIAYNKNVVRMIQVKATKQVDANYAPDIKALKQLETPTCCTREFWIHKHRAGYTIYTTNKEMEFPDDSHLDEL